MHRCPCQKDPRSKENKVHEVRPALTHWSYVKLDELRRRSHPVGDSVCLGLLGILSLEWYPLFPRDPQYDTPHWPWGQASSCYC